MQERTRSDGLSEAVWRATETASGATGQFPEFGAVSRPRPLDTASARPDRREERGCGGMRTAEMCTGQPAHPEPDTGGVLLGVPADGKLAIHTQIHGRQ